MHYRDVIKLIRATLECSQSKIEEQINELVEAKWLIEEQRRTSKMHAWQMEEMKKVIEEMTRAHRGPWTCSIYFWTFKLFNLLLVIDKFTFMSL